MNHSTPGLPVHHQLPEFTQTHVHQVSDANQPSHPRRPLFLLPPIPPSIRVFSNESTLHMRWPTYWSFSFSIIPSKEHPGPISFIIIYYYYLFFLLYNIVLVLPYINMNPPRVYTCSQSWTTSHLPPHTIPLGHPSAPAPSILYTASNLDWRFVSYMILYMFQCHSPKSSHPLPLPQSPKDCSIHNTFESVLMRWMKLELIIQSEVSQKEKHQYSILTHIYGI